MSWQKPIPGPVPPPPYPPGGAPVVIDLAANAKPKLIAASALLGGIGLIVLISALAAQNSTGVRIVAGVIGGVFLLMGLFPLLTFRRTFRPRKLIIEPAGIRWDDPKGTPWALPWHELGGVAVSTAEKVGRTMSTTLVRLDLWPRDAGFDARHPELRHLWQASGARACYRLPLGPNSNYIALLDGGLRGYAPAGLYRGVGDEGIAWGFRYT